MTDPQNGATGIAINQKIAITFSEAMDPTSIATTTFSVVAPDGTLVPGTVTYVGLIALFTPTSNLAINTAYTGRITTGARGLTGGTLAADYYWTFTTGAAADIVAPLVAPPTDPVSGAINVAVNTKISAPFSEGMDPLTITANNFFVTGPDGALVPGTIAYVGQTAIFTPASMLTVNSLYSVTLTTGIKDLAGNPLATNYTWSFTGTTADVIAPTVAFSDPANGAAGVAINKILTVTFSEEMDPLTINALTFTVGGVAGTVTYNAITRIATFRPAANLPINTTLTATVSAGAKDLAGNPMANSFAWAFTTGAAPDTAAPSVASTDPVNAATGVAFTKQLTVTFSEGMDPLTINATTFTVAGVIGVVSYDAATRVATFKPSANLAANTAFTGTVTTGAKDLAGNALAANFTWSFTTGAAADTTAPTIGSVDPSGGSTGVAVNKKLAVTFSEAMDTATLNTTTFTLTGPGGTAVAGTVTYSGLIANFTPTAALAFNTLYTATVTTGAKDVAGNALATTLTWTFTTGAAADTTAPTIASVDPASGSTGVAVNKKLAVTFSEAMDTTTLNTTTFSLTGPGGTAVAGSVTSTGLIANFTPTAVLAFNTLYTATVTTGAKDSAGNALAAIRTWTFTTGAAADTLAPTVASTDPANNASGVATNKKITMTFSEGMDSSTINALTMTVTGPGGTSVAGTVTYSGLIANFTPASVLANNAIYTAKMTTGAKDLAGNALAADYTWTFTTGAAADTLAPTVASTDPANNASGVATNKKITMTFSEGMDSSTITDLTLTVTGPGGTPVSGTVTYSGLIANFTPDAVLANNATYTAKMTTGAKDLAGNAMAADYTWTFTTGAAADTLAPTVASTDPADKATGVATNKKITMTFSEGMDSSTINTLTLTVTGPGGTPVSGTVTYSGLIANFTPAAVLDNTATYTAKLTTGAKDLAGNALAADHIWTFTTGAAADTLAPTVASTDPANKATGVATNKKITMTFSESMDSSTITALTLTVTGPGGTPVAGTVTYSGIIANFTPAAILDNTATYTAKLTTGAKDLAGNALAADHTWTFTTGAAADTLAPTVASTDPASGSSNVALNKQVTLTFSEGMDSSTITGLNFTVTGPGGTPVSGTVTYSGLIANFTPSSAFAVTATYTATMSTSAKDLAGNALAAPFTWRFTTGAAPDSTPPTVTSTDPASGAASVAINKKITLTFSEGMDSSTINTLTLTVKGPGGTPVSGAVTQSGLIADFTPDSVLAINATYTATVTTGAKDLSGNALAADFTWNFTTGAAPDTTPPTVTTSDPAADATSVALNKQITVTFDEGMDSSTLNTSVLTVTGPGGVPVAGTVTYSGLIAQFAPSSILAINATYTATVTTGAKDLAGNALAADFVWIFTTGAAPDTTNPTVTTTDPASGASDVAINKKVTVTFSEGMDSSTLNNTIFKVTGPGGTPVSGTVTYSGLIAQFVPSSVLAVNATFTGTVTTGAKDLAGNALATDFTWDFTTGAAPDTTPPTIASVDPASGSVGVATKKTIVMTFSEGMDSSTITKQNFALTAPDGTPVAGTLTYGGVVAQFTPAKILTYNTLYKGTIGTGAKDLAGNAMAASFTWTFTIITAPTVVSTDPASGAQDVGVSKTFTATFLRAMDPSTITSSTYQVTGPGGTPVVGAVTNSGLTANFAPTSLLAYNTTYTAAIGTGAQDLAGNPLAATFTWQFATGSEPRLLSVYPASNSQNVGVKEAMSGGFNKEIDPTTITSATFKLVDFLGNPVNGNVSYDPLTRVATFTPTADLTDVSTYTASILVGVKDLAGNNVASSPTIWTFMTGQAPPELGRASGFVLMATTKIDGTTGSNITGDVGLNPTAKTAITISPVEVTGNIWGAGDAAIVNAQADMVTAFDEAELKVKRVVVMPTTDLGGLTLTPGLYQAAPSFDITSGDLTLDAQGNPNAVFIFKTTPSSTLTVATGRHVVLSGGAMAKNVFWEVGSSATLNTTTIFKGNIMAKVSITVNSGSDVEGRLMAGVGTAGAGAVTFNSSKIYLPLP